MCASVCGHVRATACVCRRQIVSNMSNLREIEKPKPSAVKGFLAAIDKFNGVGGKEGQGGKRIEKPRKRAWGN